jgi:hypothetical protein
MAESNVPEKHLTHSQVGCVLNDIAMTANAMQRFAVLLAHTDDERDIEALRVGLEGMAQRIGLLADSASDRLPESCGPTYGATVDEWMMPPAFHENAITKGA